MNTPRKGAAVAECPHSEKPVPDGVTDLNQVGIDFLLESFLIAEFVQQLVRRDKQPLVAWTCYEMWHQLVTS